MKVPWLFVAMWVAAFLWHSLTLFWVTTGIFVLCVVIVGIDATAKNKR